MQPYCHAPRRNLNKKWGGFVGSLQPDEKLGIDEEVVGT